MSNSEEIKVKVPLPQFVEEIADRAAERAAQKVIEEHVKTCPGRSAVPRCEQVEKRVQNLELKSSALIGFMAGAGAVGGFVGALFRKVLGI